MDTLCDQKISISSEGESEVTATNEAISCPVVSMHNSETTVFIHSLVSDESPGDLHNTPTSLSSQVTKLFYYSAQNYCHNIA
ncbi:unnamed protein product [Allacma fusca]|uniref:Uncharacterized protein n=1 Tax=Allacma fusca TaxID=39272 RepID=A0A8J2JZC1_9HEXA|nr:unnamed protein product [Allacma fusca]